MTMDFYDAAMDEEQSFAAQRLTEQRANDIRQRMENDMRITLATFIGTELDMHHETFEVLLHDLVRDGMHPVEQLLSEVTW